MKKECSMVKCLKFLFTGILIFSSTLIHSQKKIQLNGKLGIGLLNSSAEASALTYNLGLAASYKWLELEVGYLKPLSILGQKEHRNLNYIVPGQIPLDRRIVIDSNPFTAFQSTHLLLNLKLYVKAFNFKIGAGISNNRVRQLTRTTYSKNDQGIRTDIRIVNYRTPLPRQPIIKFAHLIGPYEFSATFLIQKSVNNLDIESVTYFRNISFSRYLIDERKNQNWSYDRPVKEKIISFTPGFKFFLPIGNGLASGQSLFFEITKPIKQSWEITASIQGHISFDGFTKTERPYYINHEEKLESENINKLERFIFYKILISKIKTLSKNFSFAYGIGPTFNYRASYTSTSRPRDIIENKFQLGTTLHASLYCPYIQYRLELNAPIGDLPSHLSFGTGVPISIFKKSKKEEKLPVDLDNWTI